MASLLLPRTSARLGAAQPFPSLPGLRAAFHPTPRSFPRTYSAATRSMQPQSTPRYRLFAVSATTTSLLLVHHTFSQQRPMRCDTPANTRSLLNDYTSQAKTPIITKDGKPNPSTFRQISGGSIIGLVGGLVVASFSKALVFLLGLGVLLVQVRLEIGSHGSSGLQAIGFSVYGFLVLEVDCDDIDVIGVCQSLLTSAFIIGCRFEGNQYCANAENTAIRQER